MFKRAKKLFPLKRFSERYFLGVITKKRKGIIVSFWRVLFYMLSWPYALISIVRNWIFDQGYIRRYNPPVPVVISIGNIVAGGTGKTPATLMIAKEFYIDFSIAILSRGYRSKAEKLDDPTILSLGNGPLQTASFCGDEPFLLAQNLPKAIVIVGKNRQKASNIAAREGAQMILLDDGMQHRRLTRDFDIVIMDSNDLFGQGYFLPRGLLRESVFSLSRAHLIVLNHINNQETFLELKKIVERYTKAVIVGARLDLTKIKSINGDTIESIKGKKVGLFCAIANPNYFKKTVIEQGGEIVHSAILADHREFGVATLQTFAQQCKNLGAEMLVCTEKDRVKIIDTPSLILPIVWLQMELHIVEGIESWCNFVNMIKHNMNNTQ